VNEPARRWGRAGAIAAAIFVALFLLARACGAQTTTWSYGGFVDGAYLFAPNDPLNDVFRSRGTAWHVDDVYLNMAGAYVKRPSTTSSRWGGEVLVQAGKDDEIFGFSATAPNLAGADWLRHLGPANVSYLAGVGRGLAIQGGIFSSLIGYDSLYAKDNFNYTRPWGADFTPYLMLGVNASYPFTSKLTATAFVVNGYWHLANANAVPGSGGQIVYAPTPQLTIKETVMVGPHQSNTAFGYWRVIADTIVERRFERFVIAFNGHVASERVQQAEPLRAWWVAVQLPMQWQVAGPWRISLRPEVAWDSAGRWTLAEQTVTAFTSTLEYRRSYQAMTTSLRLEHRVDHSTGPQGGFFTDHEVAPGVIGLTPTQHLVILGLVFRFDGVR
jgi:hypothetical protein